MTNPLDSYYRKIAIVGFLIFVLAAWFSAGYHHPDEHFQILEFSQYKSGHIPSTNLAWEFHEQIRPALPVFICYGVIKFFSFFGITNPFFLAFILRLLVGLAAWWITRKLALLLLDNFKTDAGKKIFFAIIFLLWFVPYISVRFSSENLSSVTLLTAIFLILTFRDLSSGKKFIRLFGAGLMLAFAFYFRFQIAFAIIGIVLWLVFIYKIRIKEIGAIISGGIIALMVCILIDYWFYETWVLTPVNYFNINIIEDIASKFGVTPWWNYFYLYFIQVIPPLSIILLLFFFFGTAKSLRNIFLWSIVPFLIAHFMIGHKETRFLFPVVFAFLYLVSVGIDNFILTMKIPKISHIVFITLLVINIPLLVFRSFSPARESLSYYKFLYDFAGDKKIELICLDNEIYADVGLPVSFYRSPNVNTKFIEDYNEFSEYLKSEKPERVYLIEFVRIFTDPHEGYSEKVLYSVLPDWVLKVNINNWVSRTSIWKIKELTRK